MPATCKTDIALLALCNYVWGAGWAAIKHAQDQMGPVALNLWSLGFSIPVLLPFMLWELRRRKAPAPPLTWRDRLDYTLMGVLGLTGMTLLYNLGAALSQASNGALIAMSIPILTALIAVPVLGERMTRTRIASLVIAVAGVFIISEIDWNSVGFFGPSLKANLLLLGGAAGNAIYVVYGKKLLSRDGPMTVLFWGQVLGLAGSLPFLAIEPLHLGAISAYPATVWLALAFLATLYFSFTMVIFYRILDRLDAGQIMIFSYLQPLFGVVTAAVLLHEKITVNMMLGGLLVVAGTSLVMWEEKSQTELAKNSPVKTPAE